jgi:hypothetical protein
VPPTGRGCGWRPGWSRLCAGRCPRCLDRHWHRHIRRKPPRFKPIAMTADPYAARALGPWPTRCSPSGPATPWATSWCMSRRASRPGRLSRSQDARSPLDQNGCSVQAARDGDHGRSDLQILNSDGVLPQHPHTSQGQPAFNKGCRRRSKRAPTVFNKPEESSTSSATSIRG